MPELRECLAHYWFLLWFFDLYNSKTSFQLIALWADATPAEEKKVSAQDGHVYRLTATSSVKRGSKGAQTPLWPLDFTVTKDTPDPPSIQTLELKGVSTTSRAIILDMGPQFLKVSAFELKCNLEALLTAYSVSVPNAYVDSIL